MKKKTNRPFTVVNYKKFFERRVQIRTALFNSIQRNIYYGNSMVNCRKNTQYLFFISDGAEQVCVLIMTFERHKIN